MLAHRYHVFKKAWGSDQRPSDPTEKRLVGINALAKRGRDNPFEVFNELVAMRLGQLMGLAIPAGMVLVHEDKLYFASCHILAAGGGLPEADLDRFCVEKRREACGVMVFDGWIANEDRHDENMWYNYYDDEHFIFDHGHSLFCSLGAVNLNINQNKLGVRTSSPALSEYIRSFNYFLYWHDAIRRIPDETIRRLTREAASVGVDESLALQLADWLIERKPRLPQLFRDSPSLFPRVEPSVFDPFGD